MDRSFLSNEQVIEASRNFVCMRLATFEDADEAEYLKKIFRRNGQLENTVFSILSHDGTKSLVRAGRRPNFRRPSQMAEAMNQIVAEDYPDSIEKRWTDTELPEMKNLDLGINVASCDSLPVIVTIGKDEKAVNATKKKLKTLAWNDEFAGQVVFASTTSDGNLKAINGLDSEHPEGVYFVAPDQFGLSGEVLGKLSCDSIESDLRKLLSEFKPPIKDHREHVQTGFQFGLRWETLLPVTDKQAAKAAERLWGKPQ